MFKGGRLVFKGESKTSFSGKQYNGSSSSSSSSRTGKVKTTSKPVEKSDISGSSSSVPITKGTISDDIWTSIDSVSDFLGPVIILASESSVSSPSPSSHSETLHEILDSKTFKVQSDDPVTFAVLSSFERPPTRVAFLPVQAEPSSRPAIIQPDSIHQVWVAKRLSGSDIAQKEIKISLRSANDYYLGADKLGQAHCDTQAIGPTEEWEVVTVPFETAKVSHVSIALRSYFGTYLSAERGGGLRCDATMPGPAETFQVQCQVHQKVSTKRKAEESKLAIAVEVEGLKRYHGGTLHLTQQETASLVSAKRSGHLHETLLDRRSKLKGDKFCK